MGVPRRYTLVVVAALVVAATAQQPASAGRTSGSSCGRKCPAPADTTAPSVSIASPANGATVSGTVTVAGSAADNVGLAKVEVAVDGGTAIAASGTSSWSAAVGTSTLANGSHAIAATATDTAGNRATATVTVTVANPVADTTPPSVAIATPAAGASVSGTLAAGGSAADDVAVARVEIRVDAGSFQPAGGTSSWTAAIDTTTLADGAHILTARATDGSGNASTASVSFSVANTTSGPDVVLRDPAATNGLALLGQGRTAGWGTLSVVLYWEEYASRPAAFFRDASTGATSYVSLPVDSLAGWDFSAYALTSDVDLWAFGGAGPMALRHFRLSGSPVPSSAALVSDQIFGDGDSRQSDFIRLASGGLLAAWHQQGETGPEGMWFAYLGPGGSSWRVTGPLQFMPTRSSKQTVVQHPADGSVWMFADPDSYGAIGAAHLTETADGMRVDWTNDNYINQRLFGENGPDPENPNLSSAPDPAAGTIVLAYQSAHRTTFQYAPFVTGSYPVLARIPVSGVPAFTALPVYAERVASMGLVVRPGEVWLLYRPVDTSTMTFDHLEASVLRAGGWQAPVALGKLYTSYDRVNASPDRVELLARLDDGRIHLYLPS
ncbi:MAG TPA: Ig-like domain-containing protein [Acidimicrobiales bacterium]|nr:Ig-like domain-containing protein [Acidimicrobiales bacterium]